MLTERFHGHPGQPQRAPGLLRLGVPMGTHGAPDVDMRGYRRVGIRVALQVDVIPSQRPRLLGPDADQEAQHNVGIQPGRARRRIRATAWPKLSDLDGRPSWPPGVSTSVAILRRTLPFASACLMARV